MKRGFALQIGNEYFKSGNKRTKDITKAKVYAELSFLYKYAIKYFTKDNRIIEGVHLLEIGLDDCGEIEAVLDLGELWSAIAMYVMGYESAKYHYNNRLI